MFKITTRNVRARVMTAVLILFSLSQTNLVAAVVEDFDNPIGPDGRVLFDAHVGYDGITDSETLGVSGGDNDGDGSAPIGFLGFNGLITTAAYGITADQSGSGFYLHNQTGPAPVGGEVWGTITPINVNQNTTYIFSFHLANDNQITTNVAQIEPYINGASIGAQVSPSGQNTWQQFSFLWNSGLSFTADLSLRNNNGNGVGNDFGVDMIEFSPIPEPSALVLAALCMFLLGAYGGPRFNRVPRHASS